MRAVTGSSGPEPAGSNGGAVMKRWLKDGSFRALVRNTSYQAISKAAAAVFSLATLAFASRGLGPALFGLLVLIQSYVQSASGIAKFQSWQVIIRFGSTALDSGDPGPLKRAVGFSLGLDLVSAVGGVAAAMVLLPWLAPLLHIPKEEIPHTLLYCLLLPTMAAATPVGVLRALDRFDLMGWQGTVTPILRGIATGIAWAVGAPFAAYLLIWFVSALVGDLYGWLMAWRELKRRGFARGIRPALRPDPEILPGAWRFAVNVNLTTSMNATAGPVANLLVGGILGPAAAGMYRIARSLAQSIGSPADLLEKAFYPEIMRQDFSTRKPWKLMLRSAALAAGIGGVITAVILIGGEPLIRLVFGAEYRGAYPVVAIMTVATLLSAIAFPVIPALYALNRTNIPVAGKFWSTAVFLAALYPLCRWAGIAGAGWAYVIGTLLGIGLMLIALRREYVARVGVLAR